MAGLSKQAWNNITPDFSGSNRTLSNTTNSLSQVGTIFSDLAKKIRDSEQQAFENNLANQRLGIEQNRFELDKQRADNLQRQFDQEQSDREDTIKSYDNIQGALKDAKNNNGSIDYEKFNTYMDTAREGINNKEIFSKVMKDVLENDKTTEEYKTAMNQYSLMNNTKTIIKEYNTSTPKNSTNYYSGLANKFTELGYSPENTKTIIESLKLGSEADLDKSIKNAALRQSQLSAENTRLSIKRQKILNAQTSKAKELNAILAEQTKDMSDSYAVYKIYDNAYQKKGLDPKLIPSSVSKFAELGYKGMMTNQNILDKATADAASKAATANNKENGIYAGKLLSDNFAKELGISGTMFLGDTKNKAKLGELVNSLLNRYPTKAKEIYSFMKSKNFANDSNAFDGINDGLIKAFLNPESSQSKALDSYLTGKSNTTSIPTNTSSKKEKESTSLQPPKATKETNKDLDSKKLELLKIQNEKEEKIKKDALIKEYKNKAYLGNINQDSNVSFSDDKNSYRIINNEIHKKVNNKYVKMNPNAIPKGLQREIELRKALNK